MVGPVVIERLWENRATRPVKQKAVYLLARRDLLRRAVLNPWYEALSWNGRAKFHGRYAKLFRRDGAALDPGERTITFCERQIRLPLRAGLSWLDWDYAISILGHDVEIKTFYEQLLRSPDRPETFFDIGANYGTHTLLFLVAGVHTVSFEPNPLCRALFEEACSANSLTAHWEPVALSDEYGEAALVFPGRETWLGHLAAPEDAPPNAPIVSTKRLDDYLHLVRGRLLVKIDVEGHEPEVLRGACKTLRLHRPRVIFESNQNSDRPALFAQLKQNGYSVHMLTAKHSPPALDMSDFASATATNFLAQPEPGNC